MEFSSYLSIVKNQPTIIEAECFTYIDQYNNVVWTNNNYSMDYPTDSIIQGYPNNARCTFDFRIPPNTEFVISFDTKYNGVGFDAIYYGERNVDKIHYYFDGNDTAPIELTIGDNLALPFGADNISHDVFWEFTSDGSWQGLGFAITFFEIGMLFRCFLNENRLAKICGLASSFRFLPYLPQT